jgi:hypothetical protein
MSKAVARALAERCRALQASGLAADAVERRAFDELLSERSSGEGIGPNLYEDFLAAYAPEQRRLRGVYYTPGPVVAAQVRLAGDLLEQRLACPAAFADKRVLVVDPATGSGAYPLAVIKNALELGANRPRMRLFEPLAGAARLARAQGLDVEEWDVLATPCAIDAPIVVCLGNPPYRRARRSAAPPAFRADLGAAGSGIHLKNAYNDYVYFWIWAIEAVFAQRRGPGVVSFVTASSYLRGPGFASLRRLLRDSLDELWIIDLEGDHLAARRTDNVFAIRTPVAIAMGVRYGDLRGGLETAVHYARLTGSREAKLAQLDSLRRLSDVRWQSTVANVSTLTAVGDDPPNTEWSAPFTPRHRSAYATWPLLTELFPWQLSGAQLKRTWAIGPSPEVLHARWDRLLSLDGPARAAAMHETRDRDLDSRPADLRDALQRLEPLSSLRSGAAGIEPVRYAYRSFDRQWVLPDARLGDFMRPALWRITGPRQIFLTSMLTNVIGPGPAAVATALVPDLDHFRGSFGARAVIPLWRDAHGTLPNVAGEWLQRLSERYVTDVDAETLMAYCYAVLATQSYVGRFEEELRTPGPRIPFPCTTELFERAATLGRRLLWLHTFGERCGPAVSLGGKARCVVPPGEGFPADYRYDAAEQSLHLGKGVFEPLTPDVWDYSVSGMRIMPSWLRRRISRTTRHRSPLDAIGPEQWTAALTQELLEVIWVLEATLALEPELDAVLDEIVSGGGEAFALIRRRQQCFDVERLQRSREDKALPLVAAELLEHRPL